jgi:RNA-binding protein NOB1
MGTEKPVHTIVLDAGPIIRGEPGVSTLLQQCEQIISTPAVIAEIRDEATRSRLSTSLLPFLVQRNPKPDSVKIITEFSRKTGDLAVLSRVDIQLLALSYELERERNGGDWRLRKVPGQKRTNGPPPKPEEPKKETTEEKNIEEEVKVEVPVPHLSEPSSIFPEVKEAVINQEPSLDQPSQESRSVNHEEPFNSPLSAPGVDSVPEAIPAESEVILCSEISLPSEEEKAPAETATEETSPEPKHDNIEETTQQFEDAQITNASEEDGISEGSDSEGWITPSNLKKQQEKDAATGTDSGPEPKSMQVVRKTIVSLSLSAF